MAGSFGRDQVAVGRGAVGAGAVSICQDGHAGRGQRICRDRGSKVGRQLLDDRVRLLDYCLSPVDSSTQVGCQPKEEKSAFRLSPVERSANVERHAKRREFCLLSVTSLSL